MRKSKSGNRKPVVGASSKAGSYGHLVTCFAAFVDRLDKGNLAGAVEAQKILDEHGCKVTFRRRPRSRKSV